MSVLLADFLREVEVLGFEKILEIPFKGRPNEGDEKYFIFFHRQDCLTLTFNTWGGTTVDTAGSLHYQWRRTCTMDEYRALEDKGKCPTSSGGWENTPRGVDPWVYSGSFWIPQHSLTKVLARLREYGTFVSPWTQRQGICLQHYGDYLPGRGLCSQAGGAVDKDAYDTLQRERRAMLPPEFRTLIWRDESEEVCS